MFLDRYFAGTITVSANGTTVTGAGTAWVANGVKAGDYLHARGLMIRIAAVASNTSLTLAEGWPGGALSGAAYAVLYRVDADRYGAGQAQLLATLASGNLSSMAGLSGAANRVPYFAGTNTLAEAPLTAWGRSLLDDADVAAFWGTIGASSDAARAFRRGNVVGSVAQSGGVPTGALVEHDGNANGDYWRFVGGLQICRYTALTISLPISIGFVGGFRSDAQTWSYPAPFAAMPSANAGVLSSTAFGTYLSATNSVSTGYGFTAINSQAESPRSVALFAIGRWH